MDRSHHLLLLKSRCRFATLRDAIPDITDRMLSDRLQELEQEGILERTVIPETPVRVEYALTKKGRALGSAVDAIAAWAHKWTEAAAGAVAPRRTRQLAAGVCYAPSPNARATKATTATVKASSSRGSRRADGDCRRLVFLVLFVNSASFARLAEAPSARTDGALHPATASYLDSRQ